MVGFVHCVHDTTSNLVIIPLHIDWSHLQDLIWEQIEKSNMFRTISTGRLRVAVEEITKCLLLQLSCHIKRKTLGRGSEERDQFTIGSRFSSHTSTSSVLATRRSDMLSMTQRKTNHVVTCIIEQLEVGEYLHIHWWLGMVKNEDSNNEDVMLRGSFQMGRWGSWPWWWQWWWRRTRRWQGWEQ